MARSAGTKKRVSSTTLALLAGVALCAYGLDQLSKYLVVNNLTEGETVPVLGPVLQLLFVRNSGAAFSLASGMTWIFTIIASLVIVFIIWFATRIRSKAWAVVFGLLLGGVLGNLTDRFFREPSFGMGHVIDFISTPWIVPAIYNVADMAIVSSMILFLILSLRGIGLDGSRPSKDKPVAETDAAGSVDADATVTDAATPAAPATPTAPAAPTAPEGRD
ncbi:signal peptidase II [Orlajensenia leifsoniae]|uniref:Lipoprotein signal peptidase n=1 Tax=Orlajensenia leifsoniae TaxID=2561933 RepID=A0A4Y9R2K6_9MICO|nr:signal peptidase II [Leifsonia flava]TFV98884.1 signal peptidase II [Leifsonia flava]